MNQLTPIQVRVLGCLMEKKETTPEGAVLVRRVAPIDVEYLRAVQSTLEEWSGQSDEKAYRDL